MSVQWQGSKCPCLLRFFPYSTWHLGVSMNQPGLCLLALSVALFHTAPLRGFPLTTREHVVMKGWIKVAVIKANGCRQSSEHVSCDKWHRREPERVRCPCSVCFSPPGCFSCPLAFIQSTRDPERSGRAEVAGSSGRRSRHGHGHGHVLCGTSVRIRDSEPEITKVL